MHLFYFTSTATNYKIVTEMQPCCGYAYLLLWFSMRIYRSIYIYIYVYVQTHNTKSFDFPIYVGFLMQQESCCCYTWKFQTSITKLHIIQVTHTTEYAKSIRNAAMLSIHIFWYDSQWNCVVQSHNCKQVKISHIVYKLNATKELLLLYIQL